MFDNLHNTHGQPTQTHPIVSYETWLAALTSSACIGFTSLVPWLFNMTFFEHRKQKRTEEQEGSPPQQDKEDGRMKFLLSFAIGAILGDIFFHLIPESLHSHIVELNDPIEVAHRKVGLSIIAGIFMFIIVEIILEKWSHSISDEKEATTSAIHKTNDRDTETLLSLSLKNLHKKEDLSKQTIEVESKSNLDKRVVEVENNNNLMRDLNDNYRKSILNQLEPDFILNNNNNNISDQQHLKCLLSSSKQKTSKVEDDSDLIVRASSENCQVIDVAGYLSLIANGFDNFTHGLAIGASFLVGFKVGLLTTFVIFIHEIPHEICDYAILVNSGFSRWEAVKAQSSVSLFGILGTATALYIKSVQTLTAQTIWILPFSAGGFLYIALCNLLPEILETNSQNSSGRQVACVLLGIAFMAIVAII